MKGQSLISILIGLVLTTILVYGVGTFMKSQSVAQRSRDIRNDWIALRSFIRKNLNCTNTLPSRPVGCTSGANVPIYNNQGNNPANLLIAGPPVPPYTTWGQGYILRGRCLTCAGNPWCPASGFLLRVEVNLVNATQTKVLDGPNIGSAMDGTPTSAITDVATGGWADVLEGIPLPCVVP